MKERTTIIISLAFILLMAGFFRFYNISHESLWSDEGYSIKEALSLPGGFMDSLRYDYNPPLYSILLRLWINLFGTSELGVRSLSAIFGIISVYLVYLLTSKLFSHKAAIYSSLITALSLFNIMYSQEARSYALFVMLCLLSYIYYFKLRETFNIKNALLYLLPSSLMLYTHFFGIFILIAQNISFLAGQKKVKDWILLQIGVALIFIPYLYIFLLQFNSFTLSSNWMAAPNLGAIGYILFLQGGNYILLFIFIAATAIALFKNRNQNVSAVLLWWILPVVVPFILSYVGGPYLYPRYALPSSIALYVLAGLGISTLKKRTARIILVALIILLSLANIAWLYTNPAKEDWRSATSYIDEAAEGNSRILFYPGFTEYLVYDYYSQKNMTTFQVTISTRELEKADIERVAPMIGEYDKLILVLSHNCYSQELIDRIQERYTFMDEADFRKIKVIVFHN